ncbi:uncharacterized protein LOC143026616 [Oratosquilla oratoria]|uniref:uncharacterized protein LOC143026616 n=1 Tax=Oratosquilla oratoria TaxID=337810 RepID=UPI003F776074
MEEINDNIEPVVADKDVNGEAVHLPNPRLKTSIKCLGCSRYFFSIGTLSQHVCLVKEEERLPLLAIITINDLDEELQREAVVFKDPEDEMQESEHVGGIWEEQKNISGCNYNQTETSVGVNELRKPTYLHCQLCKTSFIQKNALIKHMKMHQRILHTSCQFCSSTLPKAVRRRHALYHRGKLKVKNKIRNRSRPELNLYECEKFQERLNTKRDVNFHVRTHVNEKSRANSNVKLKVANSFSEGSVVTSYVGESDNQYESDIKEKNILSSSVDPGYKPFRRPNYVYSTKILHEKSVNSYPQRKFFLSEAYKNKIPLSCPKCEMVFLDRESFKKHLICHVRKTDIDICTPLTGKHNETENPFVKEKTVVISGNNEFFDPKNHCAREKAIIISGSKEFISSKNLHEEQVSVRPTPSSGKVSVHAESKVNNELLDEHNSEIILNIKDTTGNNPVVTITTGSEVMDTNFVNKNNLPLDYSDNIREVIVKSDISHDTSEEFMDTEIKGRLIDCTEIKIERDIVVEKECKSSPFVYDDAIKDDKLNIVSNNTSVLHLTDSYSNEVGDDSEATLSANSETDEEINRKEDALFPFICKICGAQYKVKWHYERHVKTHSPVTVVEETTDKIEENEEYIWKDPYYVCRICKADYKTKGHFRRHYKMHIQEDVKDKKEDSCNNYVWVDSSYVCKICKSLFKSKVYLDIHIKVHNKKEDVNMSEKDVTNVDPYYGCRICESEFTLMKHYSSHAKLHKLKETDKNYDTYTKDYIYYVCKMCKAQFARQGDFEDHVKIHGIDEVRDTDDGFIWQDPYYVCKLCTDRYEKKNDFIEHYNFHLKNEAKSKDSEGESSSELENVFHHVCRICSLTFKRKASYNNHLKVHGKNGEDTDDTDDVLTNDSDSSGDGQEGKQREPYYACKICRSHFEERDSFESHYTSCSCETEQSNDGKLTVGGNEDMEKNLYYVCKICSNQFKKRNDYKCHYLIHITKKNIHDKINEDLEKISKKFTCTLCKVQFDVKSDFDKHCIAHTTKELRNETPAEGSQQPIDKQDHRCHVCNSGFCTKNKLLRHLLTHPGEKPYKCAYCGKGLRSPASLQVHVRQHTGERPYQCEYCNSTFRDSSSLSMHEATHTGIKRYHCPSCPKSFNKRYSLVVHTRRHTGERPFKCNHCDLAFTDKGALSIHSKTHSNEPQFKCSLCPRTYRTKHGLLVHIRGHTGERPFKCSYCRKGFKDQWVLQKHVQKHTQITLHKCLLCPKVYECRVSLDVHMMDHTGERPQKCPFCDDAFKIKRYLDNHIQNHFKEVLTTPDKIEPFLKDKILKYMDELPFKCDKCPLAFTLKCMLKRHHLEHTGEKPFKCNYCEATFKTKGGMEIHQRTHIKEERFHCNQCGKSYVTKAKLKAHMLKHTGERPFKCSLCPKDFTTKFSLKQHQITHSTERPYQCDQCGKTFASTLQLRNHLKFHSEEKPYKCDDCGATFNNASSVRSHLTTHIRRLRTGNTTEEYKCKYCNHSYKLRGSLEIHMKTHIKELPYSCSECGKRFAKPSMLRNHMSVHTGERPFKCEDCGAAFRLKSTLRNHKLLHTGELPYGCDYCSKAFATKKTKELHMMFKHTHAYASM